MVSPAMTLQRPCADHQSEQFAISSPGRRCRHRSRSREGGRKIVITRSHRARTAPVLEMSGLECMEQRQTILPIYMPRGCRALISVVLICVLHDAAYARSDTGRAANAYIQCSWHRPPTTRKFEYCLSISSMGGGFIDCFWWGLRARLSMR